ncbi:cation transporter [Staphylococcus intermedius]|uniref:Heavy-metal-associated protein n=1 Tax=Staphylococcus intermedius NCTC 11048 TaxID=1141106 RepID=A0A380G6S6_STAIN|nr:cation transporter [Staphylococcus intermedius]PCF62806.1 heavy-metal-associated protein [Staphylococcus intermedius]PCF77918.1 heavy-metal-associated protein [Staphylococcus intermedius]PCF78270.1 heavy-metal-associated protein [Staphylococcus intermedius]PCF85354.1 heavy-metal-associated protein [Staphylococcus intermedius]PCF86066.1 heavy-metal-associated protein [Staphylococcus intermedius]
MAKHSIKVEGMTCAHCKAAVEGAVKENEYVTHVEAFPADNKVEVEVTDDSALTDVKQRIYDQGYDVVS